MCDKTGEKKSSAWKGTPEQQPGSAFCIPPAPPSTACESGGGGEGAGAHCKEPQERIGWDLGGDTAEWQCALGIALVQSHLPSSSATKGAQEPLKRAPWKQVGTQHRPMVSEINRLWNVMCVKPGLHHQRESDLLCTAGDGRTKFTGGDFRRVC